MRSTKLEENDLVWTDITTETELLEAFGAGVMVSLLLASKGMALSLFRVAFIIIT